MESLADPYDDPGEPHLSYPARRNPYADTVRTEHRSWADRHGLAPGVGVEQAAWCHPDAPPDELALMAAWYSWAAQPVDTPEELLDRARADLLPRTTEGCTADWCRRFAERTDRLSDRRPDPGDLPPATCSPTWTPAARSPRGPPFWSSAPPGAGRPCRPWPPSPTPPCCWPTCSTGRPRTPSGCSVNYCAASGAPLPGTPTGSVPPGCTNSNTAVPTRDCGTGWPAIANCTCAAWAAVPRRAA